MTSTPHSVPLSVGQEAMKVAWQLDPHAWTNIIPFPLAVRGTLDLGRLSVAVGALAAAFPHLRGRVTADPGGNRLDWSDAPPIPLTEITTELGREEAVRHAWQVPFDLHTGPLARVQVITGPDWQVLLLCVHHLVSDGASMLLLLEALRQAYTGEPVTVPQDPYALEAHALRSARLSQTADGERHRAYWTAELGSDVPDLRLPAAPETPPRYSMVSDLLPADLVAGLRARAAACGVSYVTALMAGYYALLRRHSGASDVLSFVPFHGRTLEEAQQQVGYFVNLLPVRARMGRSDTYVDLMRQLRGRVKSALTHGDLPQPTIMRCAGMVGPQARELTHRSLFQYWHAGLRDGLDVMDLRLTVPGSQAVLSLLDIESTAGFTLAVMVRQDSAGTHVLWKDPAGALGESVLATLAADYHEVLWTIADDPDTPLIETVGTPDVLTAATNPASAGTTVNAAALAAMTEVWEDVLGIDGIDPKDSFFELGGHSLLAESLVIDVSRRFGHEVELRALFTWPRLVEFTEHVVGLLA
ncbi:MULTISPECIES: condensation domain-containing protein [unclassified Streptomyces]|uniref:condensation domain-containing protein n=1 Tax=unclassified Streptomyces TaxID=2593676 RepID=UPI0029A51594|nr:MULTISPECIES: condensation domain-containing protein [unclassified Streptomyces]MDX3772188.1 condensation domain-containing protein [Streptomyces sp. AK08-01B]MDX3821735.1 condensation domain-containing protein [Streptomyces sp. AK08-01A]